MRVPKLFYFVVLSTLLSSCFKDEPLNAECDIETAWVHTDNPTNVFFNNTDTLINVLSDAEHIVFTVRPGADVSAMSPQFKITDGATIVPESGSTHDFSNNQSVTYTVTSEDGKWNRKYCVSFEEPKMYGSGIIITYNFEDYKLYVEPNYGITKYYEWREVAADGSILNIWATGNAGYSLAKGNSAPEDYPTAPLPDGYDGAGVCLTTRNTGTWGATMRMPIAAGNLFLGTFDASKAISSKGMLSTNFGIRFNKEPIRLRGYYKYKPGEFYQDVNLNVIEGRRDTADIYAVLYRNHDVQGNEVVLHGDDVMTNENIVALAHVNNMTETDEWLHFEATFDYQEPIDLALLSEFGYNLTIVFSSSRGGAKFQGAVGSRLCIDKVTLECKQNNDIK